MPLTSIVEVHSQPLSTTTVFNPGIKAGATTFLYPEENQKDYEKIVETYGPKGILDNITFHSVSNIDEAMFICVEGFGDC